MEGTKQLQDMVEIIVRLYELKVDLVTSLMREITYKINQYYIEQNQMANRLKELLAKNEGLRNTDLDAMMAGIRSRQEAREKEVDQIAQIVEDFCKEEEETVAKLEAILMAKSTSSLDEFVF